MRSCGRCSSPWSPTRRSRRLPAAHRGTSGARAIDGHETDRVAARLAYVASAWWLPTDERRTLEVHRRRYAMGLLARSVTAEAL